MQNLSPIQDLTSFNSLEKLRTYIENNDFKGYDPYDALNSPILRALCFNRKYLRMAFIQFLKHVPINLRPLLGIKKDYNPKGLGLFLWGYAKLYLLEKDPQKKEDCLEKIDCLLRLLGALKSRGYSGNCWGYNFPWQSRAFYLPPGTPTIVNSSFIGHALLDTYLYTGKEEALKMAIPIKDFILRDLNRTDDEGAFCFSYTPLDRTAIHNANLLGASLLIRLYRFTGENELKNAALRSLAYTVKHQQPDGSWRYAETDYQRWKDSFHTGFVLQSMLYFLEEGFGTEYRDAFEKGVKFYRDSFFLHDGSPKYFHDRLYPIDIHAPSQAVVFFSRLERAQSPKQSHALAASRLCEARSAEAIFRCERSVATPSTPEYDEIAAPFQGSQRRIASLARNDELPRSARNDKRHFLDNSSWRRRHPRQMKMRLPRSLRCAPNDDRHFRTNSPDSNSPADFAGKILTWMIKNLQDREGFFYFQKRRLWTNRIPYMRWSQAWAFHALTEYLLTHFRLDHFNH